MKTVYTVEISDGYCKWYFELSGSADFSIKDLIDNLIKDTPLKIEKEYRDRRYQEKIL